MEINVLIDKGFEEKLDASWLNAIVEQILAALDISPDVELGLMITGQERITQLNHSYRGKDEPTDVLAFYMIPQPPAAGSDQPEPPHFVAPPDGISHLGEVIISYPQAAVQAEEHGHSIKKEIAILIIHGLLHLLGYDHDKPAPKHLMRAKEAEVLSYIKSIIE